MKRTLTLTLNNYGFYHRVDKLGEIYLCANTLHDYFFFPESIRTIYLNISDQFLPEGYRIYQPSRDSFIEIYTQIYSPFFNLYEEALTHDTDDYIEALGFEGKTFYINLQYEVSE